MQEKNPNIKQFTDKYEYTNPITRTLLDRFYSKITSLCPSGLDNIFEAGCGAGYSTAILNDAIKPQKFFASDIDPELVKLAREKVPTAQINVESIYQLPHKDKEFDMVFTLEVLEHLEKPEEALKELHRVASKYAIFSVPREPLWRVLNMIRGKYWSSLGNTPGHINHWSKNGFAEFVGQEFKVLKTISSLPWTIVLAERK
jgi:ubiquinone/menaquinone biosynthesis C-methylase UbiE